VDLGDEGAGLLECPNVPPSIAFAYLSGKETYYALSADLGLEDLYDIIEIAMVDANNKRILRKREENR
jgi:hypothetical protein